ncbi:MAG TPA: hypothetical protein VHX43_15665 [Xanthobacteraceae bacterium]|jgi:hypothetical protein|nr:hypothetical protein [Xanthobacteraceae bacterium]
MRTSAMRSADNVYYLPSKRKRSATMTRHVRERGAEFLKAGVYVTGGALIGFVLAKLPALSAILAAVLNTLPQHVV